MSTSEEIESNKYLRMQEDANELSVSEQHRSSPANSLEKLVSKISVVLVAALIFGGTIWFCVAGQQFAQEAKKPKSFGKWITGKSWSEKKAKSGYSPFDSALWPESKKDAPKVEIP